VRRLKVQAGSVMAAPNVVPMADVMLVLLIIFMLVTPLLKPGVPVEMAKVADPKDMKEANKDSAVIVAVTRDGSIYLGRDRTTLDQLSSQVRDRISDRVDKTVYIKSDGRAKYGDVVKVVDAVRSSGTDHVGLLTEKIESGPPAPPL
jgi:biopolymer transport protein TolR